MTAINNRMELGFTSNPENVGVARIAVASFAAQLDLTLADLEEIKVAVSEAVSNAVIHGYDSCPEGWVNIKAAIYGAEEIEIEVEDSGKGIEDVAQALQPTFSTHPERMGLGFVFINSFMDKLQVFSEPGKGTRVVMVKKLVLPDGGAAGE